MRIVGHIHPLGRLHKTRSKLISIRFDKDDLTCSLRDHDLINLFTHLQGEWNLPQRPVTQRNVTISHRKPKQQKEEPLVTY